MDTRLAVALACLPIVGCSLDFTTARTLIDDRLRADAQAETNDASLADTSPMPGEDVATSESTPNLEAAAPDGSTDGANAVDDGASDTPAREATVDPNCDPLETPSPVAVFVSKSTPNGTGTAAGPVSTIAAAIQRAQDTKVQKIYVDVDIYAESITIPTTVSIEGGWRRIGDHWQRICTNPRPELRSPNNLGVRISGGEVELRHLAITTANGTTPKGGDGQSTYGVWASGESTKLQLVDTTITAGKGGDGAPASGEVEGEPSACDSPIVCEQGLSGAEGTPGDSAKPGKFTVDGYIVDPAKPGQGGKRGQNGIEPDAAPKALCVPCDKLVMSDGACSCDRTARQVEGQRGSCGCGGSGGKGGNEGHSGGASIGLLLADGAALLLDDADIRAMDGGQATSGVPGQTGVDGLPGQAGSSSSCGAGSCNGSGDIGSCNTFSCTPTSSQPLAGGAAGGIGGAGGAGGTGGHGVGGPSYALVALSGSVLPEKRLGTYTPGAGGQGANAELNGASSPEHIEP